jgi:hypothetical protein
MNNMKKKVFGAVIRDAIKKIAGAVIVAAIVLIAGWNVIQSMSEVTLSDVAMANVEALAQESGGQNDCWDTITTAVAQQVLYCGTCTYIAGIKSTWANLEKC